MIVPGGGISLDGTRWVRCKPGFLLPVRVLSRLFRRLFLAGLADAHAAGRLAFFGKIEGLRRREAFAAHLAPLRRKNWFVYTKPPFAGPEAVLAYLARYTHRVAISNSRLIALDERGMTLRYKDYRRSGQARYRTMTLRADEFIRRFLLNSARQTDVLDHGYWMVFLPSASRAAPLTAPPVRSAWDGLFIGRPLARRLGLTTNGQSPRALRIVRQMRSGVAGTVDMRCRAAPAHRGLR